MILTGSGAQVGEASNDRTGWTVGAGVEWMLAPKWLAFAEYNFMGFGTQSTTFTCGGTCVVSANTKADVQNVLAGVKLQIQFLASTRKGTCRDLVTGDGSRNLGRDGGRLRTRPDLANPV